MSTFLPAAGPAAARAMRHAVTDLALSGDVLAALVSPSAHAAIAAAYESLPMFDAAATYAWDAMAEEVHGQARAMVAAGLTIAVQDSDPYATAGDMFRDVAAGTIRVLSTAATGGHPYWDDATNDTFRAVHDVIGHAATGRGFDRHGEEAAYRSHAATFSPAACLALATETRGQNAAFIARKSFDAGQRVAFLPMWARTPAALAPTASERADVVEHARRVHIAAGLDIR